VNDLRIPAVIADIDGTLCDVRTIRHHVLTKPKNFDAFHAEALHCPPNPQAIEFCERHHTSGHRILILTGRMERWRDQTDRWLTRYMPVPWIGPYYRLDGDYRPDAEIKKRWVSWLSETYDIRAAIDDNPSIIALWESLGIPVEVVPGWAEPA
jgi:hypothetical protein